jgi:ankyrin repeat protein
MSVVSATGAEGDSGQDNNSSSSTISVDDHEAELVRRVQYGDADYVAAMLSSERVSSHICDRLWLLHWAAVNNRVKIADMLLRHGANANLPAGELHEIPLQWAVRNDKFTYMTKLLLEYGSDMLHKNVNGHDALAIACIFGNVNLCYVL